jgi:hypothetical protein
LYQNRESWPDVLDLVLIKYDSVSFYGGYGAEMSFGSFSFIDQLMQTVQCIVMP